MAILVTGGAGYIGSHTCVELIHSGFDIVVVDNFCNSKIEALQRVEQLTDSKIRYYELDVRDQVKLLNVFSSCEIDAVIHFAGLKAVGESCELPLTYYENNVLGTITLCRAMELAGVRNILFSSSATVYGNPTSVPITEDFPTEATNPYGRSKLMVEHILKDLCDAPRSNWKASILRYFNPIGAHESGHIGEDPQGIPNNLLPFVAQVAVGKLKQLQIFGNDYPTEDGTGVRDYIHVVDLAKGHVKALQNLLNSEPGAQVFNLGTGRGYSVLEVVRAFEKVCGKEIPFKISSRRPGDIAECFADPASAREKLDWTADKSLEQMVEDTWRWQSQNPAGYK